METKLVIMTVKDIIDMTFEFRTVLIGLDEIKGHFFARNSFAAKVSGISIYSRCLV